MSFRPTQTKEPQVLMMVKFEFTDDITRDRDLQCTTVIYSPGFIDLVFKLREQLEWNIIDKTASKL